MQDSIAQDDPVQDEHRPGAPGGAGSVDGAPGWDAINAALACVHPGQAARHFGASHPWTLGGQDPLDGISVYHVASPRPHWHYVTYGFSELFAKESDDAEVSGFGFELTFRLALPAGAGADTAPPTWPLNLLQNLARYVFDTGNAFAQGHHLNANGPIAVDHPTRLRHLVFMHDPQLPPRMTPHGALAFLQVIGLTDPEMDAVTRWNTEAVLRALAPAMPWWITELERGDALDDPRLAAEVEAGSAREGSSTASLFAQTLEWSQEPEGCITLRLGAGVADSLLRLLPARLPFGQPLTLIGPKGEWTLQPGGEDTLWLDDDLGGCTWRPETVERVMDVLRSRSTAEVIPGRLQVRVRPARAGDAASGAMPQR